MHNIGIVLSFLFLFSLQPPLKELCFFISSLRCFSGKNGTKKMREIDRKQFYFPSSGLVAGEVRKYAVSCRYSCRVFSAVANACKRCCRVTLNDSCYPVEPQDILPDGTPCIQGFCNKVSSSLPSSLYILFNEWVAVISAKNHKRQCR